MSAHDKYIAVIEMPISLRLDDLSYREREQVFRALNKYYCGNELPPERPSEAHKNAAYAVHRTMIVRRPVGFLPDGTLEIV